jgi:TonB family protein
MFLVRMVWQLAFIMRMRLKSEEFDVLDTRVYNLKDDITPFSFFNMIFINKYKHSDEEISQIIMHEQTHVKGHHSIDRMLVESLLMVCWWNPFVWLIKREVVINLEYLADKGVLSKGVDSRDYQYHLLRLTNHGAAVQLVNKFDVLQLKKRIMMMNRIKSSRGKLAKYLMVLPLTLALITANSIFAASNEISGNEPPPEKTQAEDEVFVVVEETPTFPGGMEALTRYLNDSIRYPKIAVDNGIEGRVIASFVVAKDGSIKDVSVVRGVDPSLDKEAVRVIENMPKWNPGKQRNVAVNVKFTMPVQFSLTKPDTQNENGGAPHSEIMIEEPSPDNSDTKVTAVLRQNMTFPGGEKEMMRYLSTNIKYPVAAQQSGVQGLVESKIVIQSNGVATVGVKSLYGNKDNEPLGKEVARVVKDMPKWVADGSYIVDGKVMDSENRAMPGASVILVGTNNGTLTDNNGNFQLPIPDKNGRIAVSFVGYKTFIMDISDLKLSTEPYVVDIPFLFKLEGDNVEPYDGPKLGDNAVIVVGYAK